MGSVTLQLKPTMKPQRNAIKTIKLVPNIGYFLFPTTLIFYTLSSQKLLQFQRFLVKEYNKEYPPKNTTGTAIITIIKPKGTPEDITQTNIAV